MSLRTERGAAGAGGGIGFSGGLALLFIGLKLGHVIEWGWGWVLAPLWIPAALLLAVAVVALAVAVCERR